MSQMKEVYKSQLEMASIRLVKDAPLMSKTPIESPDKAVELLADYLSQMDREVICVINLRSDGCPINCSVC
nr:DNA repair protein RadC [Lachnospiraceae bacterium]